MSSLRRYINAGATFAWPLSAQPLQEARDRHVVTGAPGVVDSPYGRALSFDGTNDYITLGAAWEDQLRFDAGTDAFSVVAWVRRAVTGANHFILDKRDASGDGWRFSLSGDNRVYVLLDGVTFSSAAADAVTDALWHCIAFTIDRGGNGIMYIDGAASGTPGAIGGEVMATTTVPRIGAVSYDASNKFQGDIAGIVVFPRVLSPEECAGMANGGGPF